MIESVYETCLFHELRKARIEAENQVNIPIAYDGILLDAELRIDIWVERSLIVEIKAVETVLPVHHAQLMTYLKLTNNRLGLLLTSMFLC